MYKHWVCFWLWGICLTGVGHAQWTLTLKNLLRGSSDNVRLFLGHRTLSNAPHTFKIAVNFRPEGEGRIVMHKEKVFRLTGADTVFMDMRLPAGRYDVDVDIEDTKLNRYQSLRLDEPFRVHEMGEVLLSDIFIASGQQFAQVFERPLLDASLPFDQEKLYYCFELLAPGYEVLTVRAVLYQESEPQNGTATTSYNSLQQTNRVTYFDLPTSMVFQDTLDLVGLSRGEYMIQVLIYDDEKFIKDEKIWFVKGGDIKQRIFADLDNSIRMMRYMTPEAQLRQLLETQNQEVKRVEFLQIWDKLYGSSAEEEMEAYFTKIYTANATYAEPDVPGWMTDRGRIFIQYGEPRVKSLNIQEQEYIRWTYVRWALSFLFEKRGDAYYLVE